MKQTLLEQRGMAVHRHASLFKQSNTCATLTMHYRSTHPWYDVFATVAIKRHDDRDTLSNTGEVAAGGVLVGQERELTGGSLDNLLDVSCKGGVAVGINFDVNILTDFDIADSCFINIGCNSERIEVSNLGNH
jgi:hypothetical protein